MSKHQRHPSRKEASGSDEAAFLLDLRTGQAGRPAGEPPSTEPPGPRTNLFAHSASTRSLWEFVGLVLIAYVTPVILLLDGVIPFRYRFTVLLGMAALVFGFEMVRGRSWRELGFRRDTLRGSLKANVALSLVLGIGILIAYSLGAMHVSTIHGFTLFYPFYVFVSSPSQEFLFRSVIFAEMKRAGITRPAAQVVISTAIYTLPHAIYRDVLTLVVVAVIGVFWAFIYRRYPNWYGVALSHAVLGALSIAVGLV